MEKRIEELNKVLDNINNLSLTIETFLQEIKILAEDEQQYKNKLRRNKNLKDDVNVMKEYLDVLQEHGTLKSQILEHELKNKQIEEEIQKKYHIISKQEVISSINEEHNQKNTQSKPPTPPILSSPINTHTSKPSDKVISPPRKIHNPPNMSFSTELISKIQQRRQSINPTIN